MRGENINKVKSELERMMKVSGYVSGDDDFKDAWEEGAATAAEMFRIYGREIPDRSADDFICKTICISALKRVADMNGGKDYPGHREGIASIGQIASTGVDTEELAYCVLNAFGYDGNFNEYEKSSKNANKMTNPMDTMYVANSTYLCAKEYISSMMEKSGMTPKEALDTLMFVFGPDKISEGYEPEPYTEEDLVIDLGKGGFGKAENVTWQAWERYSDLRNAYIMRGADALSYMSMVRRRVRNTGGYGLIDNIFLKYTGRGVYDVEEFLYHLGRAMFSMENHWDVAADKTWTKEICEMIEILRENGKTDDEIVKYIFSIAEGTKLHNWRAAKAFGDESGDSANESFRTGKRTRRYLNEEYGVDFEETLAWVKKKFPDMAPQKQEWFANNIIRKKIQKETDDEYRRKRQNKE